MKRKWIIIMSVIAALTLVVVLATQLSGKTTVIEQTEPQDAHEGHGHDEAENENPEEAALEPCEHGMAIYLCDECRYEVGVVKISDTLVDAGNNTGLLRLAQVSLSKMDDVLEATGEIQLNQNLTARLGPAIPGTLSSVAIDLGQRVSKGQPLFTIHSAELGKAVSEYRKGISLTRLSEKNYAREKSLYERQISSELDMTEKQMEYERNRAEMEAAEHALQALGLNGEYLDMARNESINGQKLGLLPVRAPFNGTVIEKNASIGELIGPENEVVVISDLSSVWVWADVYEKDLSRLLAVRKNGAIPVSIRANAFPERSFPAVIDYIGATVNEATRTVKVRASVGNDELLLRAGMFCKIVMNMGTTGEEVLVVPRKALLSDEGKDFVFAKWKDGYFIRKPVKKGREMTDSFEIVEGLNPGETIIDDGAFLLKSDVLREKMGAGCAD
ncbi:MAG: efflux RND transporter periplasmic adaptor subunit [Candidatus Latescibacterota bacterium]